MGKGVQKSFFWIVLVILGAGVLSSYLQDESTGEAIRTSRTSVASIPIEIDGILGGNNPQRMRAPCFSPPRPPQAITQSMTICSGIYPHGIIIGADNVQMTCQPNTIFDGWQWTSSNALKDGLTISGKNNIQVTDCSFGNFQRHGISIIGGTTPHSSQINLTRISSQNNSASGIYIGSNMKDVTVTESSIFLNQADGITLTSQYIGGVDGPSLLFPNTASIINNSIYLNAQHGIYLDAFTYYSSFPSENNPLIIQGNRIESNYGDGIRNVGFTSGADKSYILNNWIDMNYGSGISIIGSKISTIPYPINIDTNFDYIISNTITRNYQTGISVFLPMFNPPMNTQTSVRLHVDNIFANLITHNGGYGVSFSNGINARNLFHLTIFSKIYQNDISWNYYQGIYSQGLGPFTIPSGFNHFTGDIRCNDIVSNNFAGPPLPSVGTGIQIVNFSSGYISVSDKNIIERNFNTVGFGILLHDIDSIPSVVYQNYIGRHTNGIGLVGSTTNARVTYNDFDQNIYAQQAYDANANFFNHNWWNDYSPGCIDANLDGWCDVPRPVPLQNRDIQPKAGISWGWKNRGYFVQNARGTGVQVKSSCPVVQLPPQINISSNGTGTGGTPGGT